MVHSPFGPGVEDGALHSLCLEFLQIATPFPSASGVTLTFQFFFSPDLTFYVYTSWCQKAMFIYIYIKYESTWNGSQKVRVLALLCEVFSPLFLSPRCRPKLHSVTQPLNPPLSSDSLPWPIISCFTLKMKKYRTLIPWTSFKERATLQVYKPLDLQKPDPNIEEVVFFFSILARIIFI